jgi:isopenicillin N synthase-like dioxygenase
MFPSFEEISRQIKEKQYAVIPLVIPHDTFQKAMEVFVDFLSLPQETKDSIYFQVEPGARGTEVGYKLYKRDLGNTDNREYFHYHAAADERFAAGVEKISQLKKLLGAMKPIYQEASNALSKVMLQFETKFPGIHEKFFPKGHYPRFYLRFLKYDRLTPGEFLAKGHYDRGSCTLALAESAPGLRMGLNEQTLHDVIHDEGRALFMPGLKFAEVTSNEFPPTWHDVVQKTDIGYREDIARWAIVFFADCSSMKDVTYEQAHTPRA